MGVTPKLQCENRLAAQVGAGAIWCRVMKIRWKIASLAMIFNSPMIALAEAESSPTEVEDDPPPAIISENDPIEGVDYKNKLGSPTEGPDSEPKTQTPVRLDRFMDIRPPRIFRK